MSKYKGLFTFDVDNHRYLPVEQADGIIYTMDYKPEEPKITDPEWRHIVRKWYELNDLEGKLRVRADVKNYKIIGWRKEEDVYGQEIDIPLSVMECETHPFGEIKYTITDLCGEEEE